MEIHFSQNGFCSGLGCMEIPSAAHKIPPGAISLLPFSTLCAKIRPDLFRGLCGGTGWGPASSHPAPSFISPFGPAAVFGMPVPETALFFFPFPPRGFGAIPNYIVSKHSLVLY
jgi:hypothetical protein